MVALHLGWVSTEAGFRARVECKEFIGGYSGCCIVQLISPLQEWHTRSTTSMSVGCSGLSAESLFKTCTQMKRAPHGKSSPPWQQPTFNEWSMQGIRRPAIFVLVWGSIWMPFQLCSSLPVLSPGASGAIVLGSTFLSAQSCLICLHIWRKHSPVSLLYMKSQNLRVCFLGNQTDTDRKWFQRGSIWAQEGKRVNISWVKQLITAQNNRGSISLGSIGTLCRTLLRGTRKPGFPTKFHASLFEHCFQSCQLSCPPHLQPIHTIYQHSPTVRGGNSYLE